MTDPAQPVRVVLGVEYLGTRFCGWQAQAGQRSVQGVLEEALSRVADARVRLTCAGRTDAGVHAVGQVAHFDTSASRPFQAWTIGTNTLLPPDLGVSWAREADADFHARFSAVARTYVYVIHNAALRSPMLADRAWWCRRPLDAEAMDEAARHLVGEHDFSSLRAAECQARSPVRRVTEVSVHRHGDLVRLRITANAFLHHMVRNVAGTLARVGRREADPDWIKEVLAARDRTAAGMTAPPGGLYLAGVDYGAWTATQEVSWYRLPGGPV